MIGGDDEELHFAFEGDTEEETEDEEGELDIPDIIVSGDSSRVRRWFGICLEKYSRHYRVTHQVVP